jgi:ketosteroid isomerase-like protein
MAVDPNESLIRKRYEALARREWDLLNDLLADDVSWHVPGQNPLSGTYVGKRDVVNALRRLVEFTGGSANVDLEDVIAGKRHVVAIERGSAEREGKAIETRNLTLFEIREGRIARMSFFPGDQYSLDSFWG